MMNVRLTRGKVEGLNACADERGVFAALAVDHRGNLMQAIAEARGPSGQASAADMRSFKSAITRVLTPYASAILLDPEYGLGTLAGRAPGTGVMLAYEKSGYYVSDRLSAARTQSVTGRNKSTKDVATKGRLPDPLPQQSVRRLVEAGAQAIKILLYYNPFDEARINGIKAEAEARFSGLLCGRATWQDGIAVYAQKGEAALQDWLADRGARNIQALNAILARAATPWWDV